MPLPVPLYEVVDQLEAADDEWRAYINRKTGEIAAFSLDMRRSVEDGEEPSRVSDWERETREDCERVLNDPDFISMPSKKRKNGTFRDIAHPLNNETRRKLEETIIAKYQEVLATDGGAPDVAMRRLALDGDGPDDLAAGAAFEEEPLRDPGPRTWT